MTTTRVLLTAALLATALTAKDVTVKLADGKGQPVGTAKIRMLANVSNPR